MTIAIRADELTKHYRLYQSPRDRFLEVFTRKPRHRVFPALQELTFEVEKGETVGLVGQNGAGKSTLLKLLCGVTTPSSGALDVVGSISSILELGTGFHPEFTGRDNASLNAAILGLRPEEIRRKLPSILEFSELGSFLDQPVKTYSSGMYMRLAFSVAVNVDPDILVIDEALAVGDGHFQKKCVDKIREFQDRMKTIFFCSHALYYISTLCHRAMWLDHGTLQRIGNSIDVVHEYETFLLEKNDESGTTIDAETVAAREASPVRIRELKTLDHSGAAREIFSTFDDIVLELQIDSTDPTRPVHLLIGVVRAADDLQCFTVGTKWDGIEPLVGRTRYDVRVNLERVPLARGDYAIIAFAGDEHAMHVYDRKDLRPAFSIGGERYEVGLLQVPHRWSSDAIAGEVAQRQFVSK